MPSTNESSTNKPRIRVLHVITSLFRAGAESHLFALIKAMDRERYEISVAYMQPYHDLAEPLRELGVHVYPLDMQRWLDPIAIYRLIKILKRDQYDLVHSHLYPADVYVYIASLFAPVRCWVSSHHSIPAFLNDPFHQHLCERMSRRQRRIIAISKAVKDNLQTVCGIDESTIKVIHYGLDADSFRSRALLSDYAELRSNLGIGQDDLVVAIIGRLVEEKGHRFALKAWAHVMTQATHAKLLIVGSGPLEESLHREANGLNLDDSVIFIGQRADVPQLMQISDALLMPSLTEGFGLVLLEAMALQKPIIASAVGAIPEIVVDGVSGLLVPPQDINAIANATISLIESPELRQYLGETGYKRLTRYFTERAMVQATDALYEEILVCWPK